MKQFFWLSIFLIFSSSAMRASESLEKTKPMLDATRAIKVEYINWRGKTAVRTIVPQEIYFGKTDYHPNQQWLLKVWDIDRNAERVYALKDIKKWFVE